MLRPCPSRLLFFLIGPALVLGCDGGDPDDDAGAPDAASADTGVAPIDGGVGPIDGGAGDGGARDGGGLDGGGDAGPMPRFLGGTITGLPRGSMFVSLNDDEVLELTEDGAFTFTTELSEGDPWRVDNLGTADGVGCLAVPNEGVFGVGSDTAIAIRCTRGAVEHRPSQTEYDATGAEEYFTRRTYTTTADDITLFTYDSAGAGADGILFTDDDADVAIRVTRVAFDFVGGDPVLISEMTGPGPDGVPLTGDDLVENLERVELSPEGHVEAYLYYTGPGPDGLWYTDDDAIDGAESTILDNTVDAMGRLTCAVRYRAGVDGELGTADDVISRIQRYDYAADSSMPSSVRRREGRRADAAGPDGVPCTDDDEGMRVFFEWYDAMDRRVAGAEPDRSQYTVTVHDADGRVVRIEEWAPGPNGLVDGPPSASAGSDDVPRSNGTFHYEVRAYDANGNETYRYRVNDPGSDGIYDTADDVVSPLAVLTYDAEGRQVERYFLLETATLATHQGPDGVLGTPDDAANRYERTEYAGPYFRCRVRVTDPGPNGTFDARDCGNGNRLSGALDDTIANVEFQIYDGDMRLVRFGAAPSPGVDGTWLTLDDTISVGARTSGPVTYSPVVDAFVRFFIQDRGGDGVAFTADDVLNADTSFQSLDGTLSGDVDGPGTDGIWLNGDDAITEYTRVTPNMAGGQGVRTRYVAPGPDGAWLTSDDLPTEEITYLSLPDEDWTNNFGIAL